MSKKSQITRPVWMYDFDDPLPTTGCVILSKTWRYMSSFDIHLTSGKLEKTERHIQKTQKKKNEGNFAQNNFFSSKNCKIIMCTYVCLDTKNGLSKHVRLNIKI